jgi:hypothetical protein
MKKEFRKNPVAAPADIILHTDMRNSADFTDPYDRPTVGAKNAYDGVSVSVCADLNVITKQSSIDVYVFGVNFPEYKEFQVTCVAGEATTQLEHSVWPGMKEVKHMEKDQKFDVVNCVLKSTEGKLAIDIGGKIGTKIVSWKSTADGLQVEHEKGAVLLSYKLGVRLLYPEVELAALREQLEYMPDFIKPHISKKILKLKREYNLT